MPPDRNMMIEVDLIIRPVLEIRPMMMEAQATTLMIEVMLTAQFSKANKKRLKVSRVSLDSKVTKRIITVQMAPLINGV